MKKGNSEEPWTRQVSKGTACTFRGPCAEPASERRQTLLFEVLRSLVRGTADAFNERS